MPEPPDFERLARRVADETGVGRLEEWDAAGPDRVVGAIAEQLRLMWNARGAADLAIVNLQLSAHLGEIGYSASTLETAVLLAIQSMDR
jgi:hypothetical protein